MIISNILKKIVTILKNLFWNQRNCEYKKTLYPPPPPPPPMVAQLNVNGKIIVNPKEIATNLNYFLVNIGPSTESNILKAVNINPAKFMKDRQQFNFIIAHISEEEVLRIINTLVNKTTGSNSIPNRLTRCTRIPLWTIL